MANKSGPGRWDHLLREIPSQQSLDIKPPAESEKATQSSLNLKKSGPAQKTLLAPDPSVKDSSTSVSSSITSSPKNRIPTMQSAQPELEASSEEETVYRVSELNRAIKRQLEGEFVTLWVQGEVSNFKAHTSGHYYFSLKDDRSQISAVMFKGYNARLKFKPESGMEVIVRGKISVYEPRGSYQVFCEHMEPVGAGALQKAFEQLKSRLDAEGLFAPSAKKTIPSHPKKIGVVTSPTGAAIQDILNVLRRRSKRAEVVVIPARVQGETAAQEVARGIELANQVGGFDVLIVGRGGGSIEDLWCFNEEIVARAIFNSKIPVISAVGHEIDFTISDFVADLRAPTPSAAAEVVARSEDELREKIQFFNKSIRLMMFQRLTDAKSNVRSLQKSLVDPRKYLQDSMLRLDDWSQRLQQATSRYLDGRRHKVQLARQGLKDPLVSVSQWQSKNRNLLKVLNLAFASRLTNYRNRLTSRMSLLDSLSPLRVVDRGYAIVREGKNLVAQTSDLEGSEIQVELRDGYIEASVKNIKQKEKP